MIKCTSLGTIIIHRKSMSDKMNKTQTDYIDELQSVKQTLNRELEKLRKENVIFQEKYDRLLNDY